MVATKGHVGLAFLLPVTPECYYTYGCPPSSWPFHFKLSVEFVSSGSSRFICEWYSDKGSSSFLVNLYTIVPLV